MNYWSQLMMTHGNWSSSVVTSSSSILLVVVDVPKFDTTTWKYSQLGGVSSFVICCRWCLFSPSRWFSILFLSDICFHLLGPIRRPLGIQYTRSLPLCFHGETFTCIASFGITLVFCLHDIGLVINTAKSVTSRDPYWLDSSVCTSYVYLRRS